MDNTVEFVQFHKLLQDLENEEALIRLRLTGEQWMEFSKVILVSDNALILDEQAKHRVVMYIRSVVEFALDQPHLEYLGNISYQISRG